MKKTIQILGLLFLTTGIIRAQSLKDGIKMYQYQKYQSAKEILAPMAEENPKANYYLGLALFNLGEVDKAKEIWERYPDDLANQSGTIRYQFHQGLSDAAHQSAKAMVAKAKRKAWEEYKYAADAVKDAEEGNAELAIEWYQQALNQKPNDPDLLLSLGDAYRKVETGGGQALSNYKKAAELSIDNSLALSRIGKLWYDARNYELALENWEKAQSADPSNPLPYKDLANAYFYSGRMEQAKTNIEKYLSLSDKGTEDQIRYATILYLMGDYEKTRDITARLVREGVDRPNVYGLLAFSQLHMEDSVSHAQALGNVRQYFATQDPELIGHIDYIQYGKIHLKNQNPDSADHYFKLGVEKDPSEDKSATYSEIAQGFTDLKTAEAYDKAGYWFGRIVAEKENPTATDYFNWGVYHYYGRNYPKADSAFRTMEEVFPDQPSAIYWQGRVAAAQDDEAKEGTAVPHYTKWLEVDVMGYERKNPDLMQAYQYLALYHYYQSDNANTRKYMNLIEQIDPENSFLKQLKQAMAKP